MSRFRPPKEEEPFLVEVAALRREPGSARRVALVGVLGGLEVPTSTVAAGEPLRFDALLESVSEGILVSGTIRAPWAGQCRRCLEPASGELVIEVRELCVEEPDDEETMYRLDGDLLDLAPLIHDACILDLPLAPLCSEECLGICPECGANRNVERCACAPAIDQRWAALAMLGERERPEENG